MRYGRAIRSSSHEHELIGRRIRIGCKALQKFGWQTVLVDGDFSLLQLSPHAKVLRDRQACLADQLFRCVPVEESQVCPIEESLFCVVESPLEQAQAKCAMGDIGDRHNRDAHRGQMTYCTPQDRCRVSQVFEHIERKDDVEGLAIKRSNASVVSRSATMMRSQTCKAASAACSSLLDAPHGAAALFQRPGD